MPDADCTAEINTISNTTSIFGGRSGRNRALLRDPTPSCYAQPVMENLKLDRELTGSAMAVGKRGKGAGEKGGSSAA
jgi:hypothetical protein